MEGSPIPPSAFSGTPEPGSSYNNGGIHERRLADLERGTPVPHNSPLHVPSQARSLSNGSGGGSQSGSLSSTPRSRESHGRTGKLRVDIHQVQTSRHNSQSNSVNIDEQQDPSPAEDAMADLNLHDIPNPLTNPMTSTPVASTSGYHEKVKRPQSLPTGAMANTSLSMVLPSNESNSDSPSSELMASTSSIISTHSTQSQTDLSVTDEQITVPIVGYEIMEERARFTVSLH